MTIEVRRLPLLGKRFDFAFDTASIGTGVATGIVLPKNSRIFDAWLFVTEAFNAGSNLFSFGITVGDSSLAVNVNLGVAGRIEFPNIYTLAGVNPLSADRNLGVRYQQSGAAATAGKAFLRVLMESPPMAYP